MALFELEMLGGAIEKRYRRMRPEVERLPWGTLDLTGVPERERVRARLAWTSAAYQEHRTAVGVTEALRLLMQAQAPLDLVALGARFPLDEVVQIGREVDAAAMRGATPRCDDVLERAVPRKLAAAGYELEADPETAVSRLRRPQ